jgi:hypothetical protein
MFTGSIAYDTSTRLAIAPLGSTFAYRKYDFTELELSIYEEKTRSYNQKIYYRTTETKYVSLSNRLDDQADGTPDGTYLIYAVYNGKEFSQYGIVKEGNIPTGNYDYYLRLPVFLAVIDQEFLIFEEFDVFGDAVVGGGWYGITDNDLYVSGYEDYTSGHEVYVRRIYNEVQWDGSLQKSSGNFTVGSLSVINIPDAFIPRETNHLFKGICSNGCIIPIIFDTGSSQMVLDTTDANGSPTATNNVTLETISYDITR